MTTTAAQDDRWNQAYANAAERLFGKVEGDVLTADEDEVCVAAADNEIQEA